MYTGRGAECGPSPLFFPKDAKLEFHIESRAEGPRHADAADPRTVAALIGRREVIFVEQVPAPEGQRPFVVIVADRDASVKDGVGFRRIGIAPGAARRVTFVVAIGAEAHFEAFAKATLIFESA